VLDREAIDADLARRQQGYGRSPRQQLEQDTVEVLAGLRHGRTLGTPLALVVRNRDHANWEWGMSPWPPEGEPSGKGVKPVTLPRPGHADLAGSLKYGLADARDALERASARQTAVAVAAGAVAKALLAQIDVDVLGRVVTEALEQRIDDARAERDTVGGVVEVRAHGVPPGLGSYATKEERLDARLAAALMGIQAVKGVEVGAGFELAERRGSEAHDEILADADGTLYRETNHAGGIEGGVSNGEPLVVRAAMKPLPTLMRPLRSVDLETGEAGEALVERSDVAAVEALEQRIDDARAERDTVGGVVEVRAHGVPPGLGSYASKEERLDARLAAALMGIQAVKGVEVGAGFELAERRGSEAHDEIFADADGTLYRETNDAGGLEGGVSNGEPVVVRAAMKPLPTLMKPLRSVDLETGEPGEALVERSDVAAVEALAVVAEAAVAFELARVAREKFGGDSLADFVGAWRAYLERIPWRTR